MGSLTSYYLVFSFIWNALFLFPFECLYSGNIKMLCICRVITSYSSFICYVYTLICICYFQYFFGGVSSKQCLDRPMAFPSETWSIVQCSVQGPRCWGPLNHICWCWRPSVKHLAVLGWEWGGEILQYCSNVGMCLQAWHLTLSYLPGLIFI